MERRVKERLIGACILVVLVVAVVPELLSGPKPATPGAEVSAADTLQLPAGAPDPVRNVTVDLATSKPALAEATAATPAVQPAAGAGAVSVPSGSPTVVDASNADAVTAPTVGATASAAPVNAGPVNATSASPESAHTPAPLPVSGQAFAVQLGSFANRSNAENLVHQLKAKGFAIYMNTEGTGGAARYRVRVGPLANRDAADRVISKLKAMGHAATIVSPR